MLQSHYSLAHEDKPSLPLQEDQQCYTLAVIISIVQCAYKHSVTHLARQPASEPRGGQGSLLAPQYERRRSLPLAHLLHNTVSIE